MTQLGGHSRKRVWVTSRLRRVFEGTVALARALSSRVRRYGVWSQLLIIAIIAVTIHWSLLLDGGGYLTWGNFLLPYTNSQYVPYGSPPGSWSPYQFMGNPAPTPFPLEVNFLTAVGPLAFLSSFLGPSAAAAIYAIASTVILGAASLLFLRSIVRNFWGRLAGATLLVAGPFQLQLFGQGDYLQFISEAFVLLSIFLLWKAVRNPQTRWLWFPLSMAMLILALGSLQMFALGLVLYGAFFLYYVLSSVRGPLRMRLLSLAGLSLRFLALPLLLAALILPLFDAAVDIGPSSVFALSLSTFASYTANPAAVFLMMGYVGGSNPPNFLGYEMVSFSAGTIVAGLWMAFVVGLVIVVWMGLLIFKDRRGYFFLAIATLGSLLGSGPHGPLGALNTYLYLHLVGYQEINASYYWDWMLVGPAVAAGLSVIVERIVELTPTRAPEHPGSNPPTNPTCDTPTPRVQRCRTSRNLKVPTIYMIGVAVAAIIVVSSALPFAVNAQNGPLGIHANTYPTTYARIDGLLERLIGHTYAGVALFNPDVNWFLNNQSQIIPNAFILFPTVRIPGLPFYAAPPFPSNFYNYWVYKEFYTNATRYVGELFAAEGVEYFLVFYGTQSASFYPYFLQFSYGKNASRLMEFQVGIVPVVTAKDFVIYRDLYYSNVATPLTNLSVVEGGYSELNAMAYAGVNLTNQGMIFPSDIPPADCPQYLNRVNRIFGESTNALYDLALTCTATSSSNPLDDTAGSQAWQSSLRELGGSIWDSWPSPLAVAHGGSYPIEVPINAQGCSASCNLWLPIRFSGDGGLLDFQWQGLSWMVNTSRGWQGNNNSMVWVQLPLGPVHGAGVLRVTSISGWNAIGTVYAASSIELTSWLQNISLSKQVFLFSPGEALQAPTATASGQFSGYCELPTVDALGGGSLCLQAGGKTALELNLSLTAQSPGELSMLVRTIGTVTFLVESAPKKIFGFDTGNYNGTDLSMSWLRVPISPTELTSNGTLLLQIANGSVSISEIAITPLGAYGGPSPIPLSPNITVQSEYYTPTVTNFNISVAGTSTMESVIAGTIRFTNATPYYDGLGNTIFNLTPPFGGDVAIQYDVSPGLLLELGGIKMGGNGTTGFAQYGSGFYSVPHGVNMSDLLLTFASYGSPPASAVTCNFTIRLEFSEISLESNVTDVEPGSNWTVTAGSSGYKLAGNPASLLLIRIPYFSDIAASPGSLLAPALGSVDSITWIPGNGTVITVAPTTAGGLNLGYIIMGLSLSGWVTIEYLWTQRGRRRCSPTKVGTSVRAHVSST